MRYHCISLIAIQSSEKMHDWTIGIRFSDDPMTEWFATALPNNPRTRVRRVYIVRAYMCVYVVEISVCMYACFFMAPSFTPEDMNVEEKS